MYLAVFTALLSLCCSHAAQRELYINFEPLPGQRDSWPVARAAIVNFEEKSEMGREFSGCRMIRSVDELAREGMDLSEHLIKRASKEEMDALQERCSGSAETERFKLIYPGTKWCGPGNKAKNESDLGSLEADKCCRDHDHCDNIGAGKSKYGLTNTGSFTLLNCDCDKEFDRCLSNAAKKEGWLKKQGTKALRWTYFTAYAPKCYSLSCNKKRSILEARCANPVGKWKENYKV